MNVLLPFSPVPIEVRDKICSLIGVKPEEVRSIHIYPVEIVVNYADGNEVATPFGREGEQQ